MVTSANPFYIDVGGNTGQGLAQLGQNIYNIRQKRAQEAKRDEALNAIKTAYTSKNPDEIAKAMIAYPEYAKVLQNSVKFHSNATKKNYIDTIKEAIITLKSPTDKTDAVTAPGDVGEMADPKLAKLEELIRRRQEFMDKAGVPADQRTDTDNWLDAYKANPEEALKMLEMEFAGQDPDSALKLAKVFGAGTAGSGKTPASIQEFEYFKKLKETDPEGAKAFGRAKKFLEEPREDDHLPTSAKELNEYLKLVKANSPYAEAYGKKVKLIDEADNDLTADEKNFNTYARLEKENPRLAAKFARQIGMDPKKDQSEIDLARTRIKEIEGKEARAKEKTKIEAEKRETKTKMQISQSKKLMDEADEIAQFVADNPNTTTGIAYGLSKGAWGFPAYILNRKIAKMSANLGFDKLQEMRDASPTGGALGQVSERELYYLQSTVAALDPAMGDEQFLNELSKAKEHYKNWLETLRGNIPEDYDMNDLKKKDWDLDALEKELASKKAQEPKEGVVEKAVPPRPGETPPDGEQYDPEKFPTAIDPATTPSITNPSTGETLYLINGKWEKV